MVAHAAETEGRDKRKAFDNRDDFKDAQDFVGSFSGYENNRFFLNRGAGQPFLEAGYIGGVAANTDGRATAAFDLEGDGRPDLAVLSLQDFRVYRNTLGPTAGHFIELELVDRLGRPAINAHIEVLVAGRKIVDKVRLTAGFHTQVQPRIHVGVGLATLVDEVRVRWPSGQIGRWRNIAVDQRYRLREGRSKVMRLAIPTWPESALPTTPMQISAALNIKDMTGTNIGMIPKKRPAIVNIWAPWCEPCKTEAPHLQHVYHAHADWLSVVGVSAAPNSTSDNQKFIQDFGLTYPNGILTEEAVKAIFGDHGQMKLPTTLIFDQDGRLVRRFSRAVTASDLDVWIDNLRHGPSARDYARQQVLLESQGDSRAAFIALQKAAELSPTEVRRQLELARAAVRRNESHIARRALEAALKVSPSNETVWQLYVDVLESIEPGDVALRLIEKAPRTATLLVIRANLMAKRGVPDEAIRLMKEAIKLKPKQAELKQQLDEYIDKRSRGYRPDRTAR